MLGAWKAHGESVEEESDEKGDGGSSFWDIKDVEGRARQGNGGKRADLRSDVG